ncbi:MAG: hypothetical protein VB135_01630 [Burkholderia sp.]
MEKETPDINANLLILSFFTMHPFYLKRRDYNLSSCNYLPMALTVYTILISVSAKSTTSVIAIIPGRDADLLITYTLPFGCGTWQRLM